MISRVRPEISFLILGEFKLYFINFYFKGKRSYLISLNLLDIRSGTWRRSESYDKMCNLEVTSSEMNR